MFSLKRYTDTERICPMRHSNNKNGRGRNGDGKPNAVSFSELEACPQSFLRNRSPDPQLLDNDDVEDFRQTFLYQYPLLEESVTDTKIMRRLMLFAVRDRRRRMTAMKKPRNTTPATL